MGLGSNTNCTMQSSPKDKHSVEINMNKYSFRASSRVTDHEDLANKTVDDVIKKMAQGLPRSDTLLFKFVRGGNVQMVNRTLDMMDKRRATKVRDWVLGKMPDSSAPVAFTKVVSFLPRVLLCLATYIIMLALTPVFYLVHGLCNDIMTGNQAKVSDTMDLPLAHAVLSENEHMVQLFIENGVMLDHADKCKNNVFHFIFEVSRENYKKAKDCFQLIVHLFPMHEVRKAILDQENDKGSTALDTLSRVGCMRLLKEVTQLEAILKRTVIVVDEDSIHIRQEEMLYGDVVHISLQRESHKMNNDTEDASFCVQRYDVTQYEKGDTFQRQSRLLKLLTERDYIHADKSEMEALTTTKWLARWSSIKVQSTRFMYVIDRLLTLVIGMMFLYVMFTVRGGYSIYPLAWYFMNYTAENMLEQIRLGVGNVTESEVQAFSSDALNSLIGRGSNIWSSGSRSLILDTLCVPNVTQVAGVGSLDSCASTALQRVQKNCFDLAEEEILHQIGFTNKPHTFGLNVIMLVCLIYHASSVVFNIIFRTVFFLSNYPVWKGSILKGPATFLSSKLPGSYIESQMSILSSSFFIMTYSQVYYMFSSSDLIHFHDRKAVLIYSMAIGLTILMFQIIYILRLAPVIGLFIRTIVHLMKNLIEFVVVYMVIGLGFAIIFNFILVDEKCPAKQMEGYESILLTFFSGYLAMLGQGDLPVEHSSMMKIVYGVYSLLSAVMLLNLIIAVMGTTTDKVMVPPWRDVLHSMEVLSLALYHEALIQTFLYPFRKCFMKRLTQSKAFVEYNIEGLKKFYIEVEMDNL